MGWQITQILILVLSAIIILVLLLPVGVCVIYRNQILKIWLAFGPVKVAFKTNNAQANKSKKQQANGRTLFKKPAKANGEYHNLLGEFLSEIKAVMELFGYLRPRLRIRRMMMELRLAGENPAAAAMQYGGAWAAIGVVVPILEEAFVIKKRKIDIDCEFTAEKTTLNAKLDIRIGLGRLLWCLLWYGIKTFERMK